MPFIRVKTGPNKGKIHEVKDRVITIGRDESQTIQILDQGVSRMHAEIFRLGDMVFVRDLNSTNGTFVNSVRVTEEVLKPQDELLIGTTILYFEDKLAATDPGVEFEESEKDSTTTVQLGESAGKRPADTREVSSRHLRVIGEIGRTLSSDRELKAALQNAAKTLAAAIEADHGYVLMADPVTSRLIPHVSIERGEEGTEKKVSRTIVKHVMQNGAPIMTADAALDDRFTLSESVVLKRIKSVVAAPILVREQVQGLIYFHASRVGWTFKIEDLELVASAGLQISMAVANHLNSEKVRRGMVSAIRALVTAMEIADPKNQGHSERVSDYALAIAHEMGLPREDLHRVRLAGLLHDVGKLASQHSSQQGVNLETLQQQHVVAGEKILAGIEGVEEILPGLRYHHERADGSGYPFRLTNDKTPLVARIIIVANHLDNVAVGGGPRGAGMSVEKAIEEVAQGRGKLFDEDVVEALLQAHRKGTLHAGAKLLEG